MPSLDAVLTRVEPAGDRVIAPKTALPPGMGFIAHLRDTEGNEVGLHALADLLRRVRATSGSSTNMLLNK